MTLPDKAIEAGARALLETNPDRFAGEYLVAYVEPIIQAALQSFWQPIESAPKDREWTTNTPFGFGEGVTVAYDEETNEPLFLVHYVKEGPGIYGTDMWAPLLPIPHPKGEG